MSKTDRRLLDTGFGIRMATPADVDRCQQISREFPSELHFVMKPALQAAVNRRELYVAQLGGGVVGFVHWHRVKRGVNKDWNVVYEIAVGKDFQSMGIGRALLYAVPCPVRLRCTEDNDRGNRFYERSGMVPAAIEDGRKRRLIVWERRILAQLVMGSNKIAPTLALQTGHAYGTRSDHTAYTWPFALDVKWEDYNWSLYLDKVSRWRPVQALVPDLMNVEQVPLMLEQIQQLRDLGVLRIVCVPKFNGAVQYIPNDCIVGVSVPSSYAGFLPDDLSEFSGRELHLLGGSPSKWRKLIPKLQGAGGLVISVDGNSHLLAARFGSHFNGRVWEPSRNLRYKNTTNDLRIKSGLGILHMLNTVGESWEKPTSKNSLTNSKTAQAADATISVTVKGAVRATDQDDGS